MCCMSIKVSWTHLGHGCNHKPHPLIWIQVTFTHAELQSTKNQHSRLAELRLQYIHGQVAHKEQVAEQSSLECSLSAWIWRTLWFIHPSWPTSSALTHLVVHGHHNCREKQSLSGHSWMLMFTTNELCIQTWEFIQPLHYVIHWSLPPLPTALEGQPSTANWPVGFPSVNMGWQT